MRAGLGGSVRPLSPAVPLPPQVYNTFPSIMHHLPGPHKRVLADCQKLKDHIREKVQFHQLTLDSSCPRDYIDCFLMKAEKVAGLQRGAAPSQAAACNITQTTLNPSPPPHPCRRRAAQRTCTATKT